MSTVRSSRCSQGRLVTSSGRHFERAEQDPGVRLLFVLACLVVVVSGPRSSSRSS